MAVLGCGWSFWVRMLWWNGLKGDIGVLYYILLSFYVLEYSGNVGICGHCLFVTVLIAVVSEVIVECLKVRVKFDGHGTVSFCEAVGRN